MFIWLARAVFRDFLPKLFVQSIAREQFQLTRVADFYIVTCEIFLMGMAFHITEPSKFAF